MSKLRFSKLFCAVDSRAMRHAATRAACAGGVALSLALTSVYVGCGTESKTGTRVQEAVALDPWLGPARAAAGSPQSEFDVELEAETTSPEAPGRSRFLRLAGTWTFTKASQGAGRQVLAELKLSRLELSDDHALPVGKDKYRRRIRAELERAVVFDLNERGAVVAMHAPRDLVSTALGAIRMLAASFQLTMAPAGAGGNWTAREQDASGTYRAEYRALGANAIVRKKTAYTELPAPEADSAPVKYEIRKSEARFELSPSGSIASSAGSESVLLDDGEGALPPLEMKSSFRIARRADTTRAQLPEQSARLMALPSRALNAAPEPEAQSYELDLAKAASGTRLDAILTDMARTDPTRGAGDTHAFRRLNAALEAAVRIDEDAEHAAFARSEPGQPYAAELLTALARSNRPEALLHIAKRLQPSSRLPLELRARTLIALSKNAYVTRPVVRALEALTSDPQLGEGAVLGLGALSYRLQRTDPLLAQEIHHLLAARLDQAGTREQTELALRALGNAGNGASLPKLERFLVARDPKLRAVAVEALRRLEGPEVNALLAQIQENDTDEAVQDAVQSVLATRNDRT